MRYFLGLDCGGSTARARVEDQAGSCVYEGSSGPANLASTPPEERQRHLREALQDCPPVSAAVACFAGLLTRQDAERAHRELSQAVKAERLEARPDFHATLASAPDDASMAVIAGTGSVVASRGPQGTFKSGGGGPLLGDYGSAFYVGKLAVYHTLVSAAPYEASPAFAEACRELFGSDEPAEVMASIYREPSPAWKVAKLAPTVAKDYERGEQYAKLAVETSSAGLAKEIGSHAKRHGQREQPLRICLAGGLWSISPLFKQLLQQQLEDELEVEFELVKPVRTPLEGSVRLAREISTE